MALLGLKMATNFTSLSRLAVSSDYDPRPSVGRVRFEFDFLPLMAICVVISGVVVLVGAWAVGLALAPDGGAVPPVSSVGMEGENSRSYCCKTTCHSTGAASVATTLCLPTLAMGLGAVLSLGLAMY